MQQRETLQEHIYKDILMHIYEGELPDGSQLPTLEVLCRQYQASDKCIRKVICRLKENGFITTMRGRTARITFNPQNTALKYRPFPGFSCDKKVLYSFYEAMNILFPSIYTYASMNCTASQWKELSRIISKLPYYSDSGSDYVELNIRFFRGMLSSVKNRLLIYVVKTVMQNTILPAALIQQQSGLLEAEFLQSFETMRKIFAAMHENDVLNLKKLWEHLFETTENIAKKALESYPDVPAPHHENADSLQSAREFKYILIAYDLYDRILEGKYPVGALLPTISEAREFYHAASVTIRTAYRILNDFGIVETINGQGTKVVNLTVKNESSVDETTQKTRRHDYLEVLEFLQIICGDIIRHAHRIPISLLRDNLEGPLNPAHQHSALILCRCLMKAVQSPAIDTFYQIVSRKLYWGSYLKKNSGGYFPEEEHSLCLAITGALEQQQTERTIDLTQELLHALRSSVSPSDF